MFQVDDDAPRRGGFAVGGTVAHPTLGNGRVLAVQGSGKDLKIVVDFGVIGQKTVYARYLAASDDSLN